MTRFIHSTAAYLGDLRVDVAAEMASCGEDVLFIDSFTGHTGIRQAFLLGSEDLLGLACGAAYDAMAMFGGEVRRMICVTQTFEPRSPGLGFAVCEQLGWKMPVIEVNSACQGFTDALILAEKMAGPSLIVCADQLGSHVRRTSTDRAMRYLFSDAASACVVSGSDLSVSAYHPELWHDLCIASRASHMNGEAIACAACRFVPDALRSFIRPQDNLVLHQANETIVTRIGRRLGRPAASVVGLYANCSSSSIPVALAHLKAAGPHTLCGYGAGFALSAVHTEICAAHKLVV